MHLDRCLVNTSVMYISDFKAALSISTCHLYLSHIQCEKGALAHTARVTADLQLLHAPESEGIETPGQTHHTS